MQTKLTQLIRELKNEKCPQRARDRVRGRIAAREPSRPRFDLTVPLTVAVVALACGLFLGRQQTRKYAQDALLVQRSVERAQVAHQARNALGFVGSVLLSAGNDSGQIISDRTVPPLRSSFETAKNKIIPNLDL
jgi:anti-sigma factor RsiW